MSTRNSSTERNKALTAKIGAICGSCRKRPAKAKRGKVWRCDICLAARNESGFKGR